MGVNIFRSQREFDFACDMTSLLPTYNVIGISAAKLMYQQTSERMAARLQEWEAISDGRQVFLDCYSRMTRNMLVAIDQSRFEDSAWVAGLLRHFADYYFDALTAFDLDSQGVPEIWVHAHRAALNPRTTAVQNLLLGVNAHINFDLVFALYDVLEPEWPAAGDALRASRYSDHCMVNQIIGETVDEVQDEVIERFAPSLDVVDKIAGPVDEWFVSWMIAKWREEVWHRAIRMLSCDSAADRDAIRHDVASSAMERARLLLIA